MKQLLGGWDGNGSKDVANLILRINCEIPRGTTILVFPFQQQIKDVKGRRFEGKSLRAQKEKKKVGHKGYRKFFPIIAWAVVP